VILVRAQKRPRLRLTDEAAACSLALELDA
jgi:hypothetical protein